MQDPGASASKDATPDPSPPVSQPSSSYTIPQPRKTLRSKMSNYSSLATAKTKEELLANPLYLTKISTIHLAQKHLAENSLLLPNQDPSLPDLVMVVLNLAYTIPNLGAIGAEALHAVAILIDTPRTQSPVSNHHPPCTLPHIHPDRHPYGCQCRGYTAHRKSRGSGQPPSEHSRCPSCSLPCQHLVVRGPDQDHRHGKGRSVQCSQCSKRISG